MQNKFEKPVPLSITPLSSYRVAAFFQGVALPFRSFKYLLQRPRLWLWVAIPLLLNLILFAGFITWGFSEFAQSLNAWFDTLHSWYWTVLLWLARILFWGIVLIIVYFLFTPLALLISAPFNDRLAESVEKAYRFNIEDNRPFLKMILSEALYALLSEAKRLVIVLGVLILLFLLNFIPAVGPLIYPGAVIAWLCWSMALEFTSYPADRRHLRLRQKWALLRRHLAPSVGFGLITLALMSIPFLNVFIVPISAVGGTMLFRMIDPGSIPNSTNETY